MIALEEQIESAGNYRANRENGEEQDNPRRNFSADGKYKWVQSEKKGYFWIRYTKGPGDRDWMKEK